jgi:hypothetical protein
MPGRISGLDERSFFVHGLYMTNARRKPTRLEQDLARKAPEQINAMIRKLSELAQLGVKRAEEAVARVRSADDRPAGTPAEGESAPTLDEAVREFERISRGVRLAIRLSMKLREELWAREEKAARGITVLIPLDPRLQRRVDYAISLLAEPYKATTRH